MKRWQLQTRFMVAYAGLIVLGFAGLALIAGQQISQGSIADFETDLTTEASVLARSLREPMEQLIEGETNETAVFNLIADFANRTNTQITLINTAGQAWLKSDGTLSTAKYTEYAEVAAALEGRTIYDVRDDAQGITTGFAAAPINEDDKILSVVQISAPLAEAQALVFQRWLTLAGGVLLLSVLAVLASYGLSASLTRPLTQLRNSALKMADGDLSQRLPETRQDEIGQLAAAFNHMAGQVEAMIAEQRAFASNASHELRTPLTTIRLRSEALRDDNLDEATSQQYIIEIDDEVRRMGNLVQDLILLSRLDGGRSQPGQEKVDPRQLAHSLLREIQPQADAKQITLTLNAPDSLPFVEASLTHLQIVFRNLLQNSLKYTPAGGQITWQLQVDETNLHAILIDTGQGIAADDLPHLFERFYRANKARTREVDGVGLGLSLVQTVIKLYNGRIQISSPGIGAGTAVNVWWPFESAQ